MMHIQRANTETKKYEPFGEDLGDDNTTPSISQMYQMSDMRWEASSGLNS
jgi:hypothetical protein